MSTIEFTGFPEGPKTYIWPDGKMPDVQPHQIAAITQEVMVPGFNPDEYRRPTLQWFQPPEKEKATDLCMVIISGGGYNSCCDMQAFSTVVKVLQETGIHCVNLAYRTPRAQGIPIYKTAWEDAQRAIRLVRLEAKKRGFSPDKIGIMGCSAGSHLGLLLALSSKTPAYARIDEVDDVPCNISWAVTMSPAYLLTDGLLGPNERNGHGADVTLDSVFAFDDASCPVCFVHGGKDPYSPMGSVHAFCRLRRMGIPAEIHMEADAPHGFTHNKRIMVPPLLLDFLRHLGYLPGNKPKMRSAEAEIALVTDWGRKHEQGLQDDLEIC